MGLEEGIIELRRMENQLEVVELFFTVRSTKYKIIGVSDLNRETNLYPYQNMAYFVVDVSTNEALVVDPGIRGERGFFVRDRLGIDSRFVVLTHYHLDHWVGFEPYRAKKLYATPRCIDVLTTRNPKALFYDGGLAPGHTRETPERAREDAKKYLPLDCSLFGLYSNIPNEFPIQFCHLPGQTLGTLYGAMKTDQGRIIFGGDLFVQVRDGNFAIEPHYSEQQPLEVVENAILLLKSMMGGVEVLPRYEEEFPHIRKQLEMFKDPYYLFLGHGSVEMSDANKQKVSELIRRSECIVESTKRVGFEEAAKPHKDFII